MTGLDWAGALVILALVACIFACGAVMVRLNTKPERDPGQFSHPTFDEPDEPADEEPLAAEVAAWLHAKDAP